MKNRKKVTYKLHGVTTKKGTSPFIALLFLSYNF
jgi:hypothetical protein